MNSVSPTRSPQFPKMLASLSHANQYLKAFSMGSLGIAALSLAVLMFQLSRPPIVLTLQPEGERLVKAELPLAEEQIRVGIRHYLEMRYHWDASTVKQRLSEAQAFIHPHSLKAYQAATLNLVRFSTEKQVAQRIFPENVEVSLSKGEVVVTGDRITTIQGLKAAGALSLQFKFESGPRTEANPWGLYLLQEKEVQ